MKELFCLSGLSAVEFETGAEMFSCCGKINVRVNGKNMIGYIMEENNRNLQVILSNNKVRYIKKPPYIHKSNKYMFDIGNGPLITEYWPVRLKCHTSGEMSYTLNRICLDSKKKLIFNN